MPSKTVQLPWPAADNIDFLMSLALVFSDAFQH